MAPKNGKVSGEAQIIVSLGEKRVACDQQLDEITETTLFGIQTGHETVDLRSIRDGHCATCGVDRQFRGQIAGELVEVASYNVFEAAYVAKLFAVWHLSG